MKIKVLPKFVVTSTILIYSVLFFDQCQEAKVESKNKNSVCGAYYTYAPSIFKILYYYYFKGIEFRGSIPPKVAVVLNCDSTYIYYGCDTTTGKWKCVGKNIELYQYDKKNTIL